jgi:DNA-binding MarR family transcriptional regulator
MLPTQIADVRRFQRLVTQRAGALDERFLGGDRPLGASRVLYEIGPDGADLRDVRARLDLDSGYLSRLIQRLAAEGLVTVRPGADDERVRRAELTPAGRAAVADTNRRSDEAAAAILAPLTEPQRARLVAAMAEVHGLLRASAVRIERVDPASSDARWCLARYFDELARRFAHGFDPRRSLPTDDAELRPPSGAFLVGRVDGELVACGALKTLAPGVGYLRRMWIADAMRGVGFGRRMLGALEDEARALGFHTLRLETNRALTEAIGLYRSAGYAEVTPFNAEPYADHWFEKPLG